MAPRLEVNTSLSQVVLSFDAGDHQRVFKLIHKFALCSV